MTDQNDLGDFGEQSAGLDDRLPSRDMYSELVAESGHIDGMVAYALYKENKREWIGKFRTTNNQEPTPAEIDKYVALITDPDIDRIIEQAQTMLLAFSTNILENNKQQIENDAIENSILYEVKKQNSFPRNVMASVVGAIGLTILVAIGAFLFAVPAIQDLVVQEINKSLSTQTR